MWKVLMSYWDKVPKNEQILDILKGRDSMFMEGTVFVLLLDRENELKAIASAFAKGVEYKQEVIQQEIARNTENYTIILATLDFHGTSFHPLSPLDISTLFNSEAECIY